MKNVTLVFFIFVFIAIFSCEKEKVPDLPNEQITEFINSGEFCRNEVLFASYGKLVSEETKVESFQIGKGSGHYLMLPIKKNDKIVAYLQTIKLNGEYLPNNDIWAMNLIDISNFDNQSMTGNVSMYDLNFDGFRHSDLKVKDNIISVWECFDLPLKLELKYHVASKGYVKDFFKCYRSTKEELLKSDFMYFVCDVAKPTCVTAISAYCIYWLDGNHY